MTKREAFLEWAKAREGCPYVWAAKGGHVTSVEGKQVPAYDCSGFIVCGLEAVGWDPIPARLSDAPWISINHLWRGHPDFKRIKLARTQEPRAGDLAIYGTPQRATHGMILWENGHVIGACGGNQHTVTPALAARVGAKVRFRPSALYRSDLLGYLCFPLDVPTQPQE